MIDTPKKKRGTPREKPKDFRVKLTASAYEKVIQHIEGKGFTGPFAKQDWLRSQIAGMAAPAKQRAVRSEDTPQRLPMPGGQEALARLGNVGTDLREMKRDLKRMREWIDRIDPVLISDEHRDRVRNDLPDRMDALFRQIDLAERLITPQLDQAIEAVRKANSR